ncbi:MAG: MaoC/PaaZ C-terminal domain-containing protein [Candidatus Hodarchaeota archaeon]
MEIDSTFVGTSLKKYSCKVNWRDIMNYAAATEDNNQKYFDDEKEEGIVAPPMFAVSKSWPILENLSQFIEAYDFPTELFFTIVHYTEHLKIHRLIKPGDELEFKGKIAAILPHRAGTHIILCLEVTDNNNKPVFTEFLGGMLRGVECIGGAMGEKNVPVLARDFLDKENHDPLWEKSIVIDPLRTFIYDGCTGISFPIHTSKQFARQVGLPGIILHGTATLAFAVKELTNKEANGNPSKIKEIACKFTDMVFPGSIIKLILQEREKTDNGKELIFEVHNDKGKKAIREGYVLIKE